MDSDEGSPSCSSVKEASTSQLCVNMNCSGLSQKMVTADHFSLAFYAVEGKEKIKGEICIQCMEEATDVKSQLVQNLVINDTKDDDDIILILEDEENYVESIEDGDVNNNITRIADAAIGCGEELDGVIKKALKNVDFDKHLDDATNVLVKRFDSLQQEFDETEEIFCKMEENFEKIRRELLMHEESVERELSPLDIGKEDGNKATTSSRVVVHCPTNSIGEVAMVEDFGVWNESSVRRCSEEEYIVFSSDSDITKVSGHQVAFRPDDMRKVSVGTNVVAKCENGEMALYKSAVVAEPPKVMNKNRYLLFFEDSNAIYVQYQDMFVVAKQTPNVWDGVSESNRKFLYDYFQSYPERLMVKLYVGQKIKAKFDGKWGKCNVVDVDASLVLLCCEETQVMEWLYRGSLRLGPLFIEIEKRNKKETDRAIDVKKEVTEFRPSRAVARKSTVSVKKSVDSRMVGICKETEGTVGTLPRILRRRGTFQIHDCSILCVTNYQYHPSQHQGTNPLLVPLLLGWDRQKSRHSNKGRRKIFYLAPCGRRLSNLAQVHQYLTVTELKLEIDSFCFDWWVHVESEFKNGIALTSIKDLSYGAEAVPVPCVNTVDNSYPEYVEYSTSRLPQKGVIINTEEEFLTGCDCVDDCVDKEKCQCWQLTIQNTKCDKNNEVDPDVGYEYKRLHDMVLTGIYECNSLCKCSKTCFNRVVQNPLKLKLQVFKTARRGWGIRALNDIPGGTYILSYVGKMYSSVEGNRQGRDFGDEYFADLDMIEVVESRKEGYESDVSSLEVKSSPSEYAPSDDDSECDLMGGPKKKPRSRTKTKKGGSTRTNDETGSGIQNFVSTRKLFGTLEESYIMDAKTAGNIGRFFNHSCNPNVFVQNVFVDTHDLRFPWVSFFTSTYVKAGQELCWDYGYEVGSIPGKEIFCCCGAHNCRGRLL